MQDPIVIIKFCNESIVPNFTFGGLLLDYPCVRLFFTSSQPIHPMHLIPLILGINQRQR